MVFTDLDGSLMEHESYSIEPARPSLDALMQRGCLLVMNSSKTAVEIHAVQQMLAFRAPFICENGAALHLLEPDGDDRQEIVFGRPRAQWLATVHQLRDDEGYDFEGFADWSPARISELTGLSRQESALARARQYSEPIHWHDPPCKRIAFEEQLAAIDLQLLEGGRFLSIQGRHSKSDAMHWLRDRQPPGQELLTVALGDSPNDSAMLEAADIAVIIKSGKSERILLQSPKRVIRTRRPGPAGWHDAVSEILAQLDANELTMDRG